jgi:serine/threonine protein kinase
LLKRLSKDPQQRYSSAEELADDWNAGARTPVVASPCAATLVLMLTVAVGSSIAIYRSFSRMEKRLPWPSNSRLGSKNAHGALPLWRAPSWMEIETKETE